MAPVDVSDYQSRKLLPACQCPHLVPSMAVWAPVYSLEQRRILRHRANGGPFRFEILRPEWRRHTTEFPIMAVISPDHGGRRCLSAAKQGCSHRPIQRISRQTPVREHRHYPSQRMTPAKPQSGKPAIFSKKTPPVLLAFFALFLPAMKLRPRDIHK